MAKPTIKTKWDLTQLYQSPSDPKLETDMQELTKLAKNFQKRWQGKLTKASVKNLKKAIADFETVYAKVAYAKPFVYVFLSRDIDQSNAKLTKLFNSLHNQLTELENYLVFFELELAKRGSVGLHKLAKDKTIAPYGFFIEKIAKTARHQLTEPEEKILNLTSLSSQSLWIDGVEKALSKKHVTLRGKKIPLNGALEQLYSLPNTARHKLFKECVMRYKEVADFAESEMNALLTHKKVTDNLRGYARPQTKTIEGYDNTESEIDTLVDTVVSNYPVCHEFFSLKKELFKLDGIHFADRRVNLAKLPQLTFEYVSQDLLELLESTKPEYANIFKEMLRQGNIDVHARKNKAGGGYQLGGIGFRPFILLNYTPGFRAATTLAHEIGHAIHSERSKCQTPLYQDYSTSAAETASTFFESLYVDHLIASLPKQQRIPLLHDKIAEEISSIFYTVSVYRLEEEYHRRLREQGALSNEELVSLMNDFMKQYVGKSARFHEDDGHFYTHLGHLRRPFYMYTYAYGHLISKVMLGRYQENSEYIEKVDEFLSAGSTKPPKDIFKGIGITTTNPKIFQAGIDSLAKDIKELKRLMRQPN